MPQRDIPQNQALRAAIAARKEQAKVGDGKIRLLLNKAERKEAHKKAVQKAKNGR